jgi:excisionase family DNA binding protein
MNEKSITIGESSEELLTYQQVQAEFSLPRGTLFFWVHNHHIPHLRLGPRTVRFRRSELRRWLDARAVTPKSTEKLSA